jgi:hypothetical protein
LAPIARHEQQRVSSACCHFICALICALPDKEIKQRAPPFNFGFVARVPMKSIQKNGQCGAVVVVLGKS